MSVFVDADPEPFQNPTISEDFFCATVTLKAEVPVPTEVVKCSIIVKRQAGPVRLVGTIQRRRGGFWLLPPSSTVENICPSSPLISGLY
jgi:hypothetical protein